MIEKKNLLVLDNSTALVSPWKNDIKTYFNCIEVVGGFEALSKLKAFTIAAVIVNLSIKTFNGLDAVIKLREKDKLIPIVVLADKNDIRFVKNATIYGIHGYFLFPFKGEDLLSTLTKITGISIAQMLNEMSTEQEKKEIKKNEKTENNGDNSKILNLYYEGQSFLLHENVDQAIETFNQIFNEKVVKDTCRKYWEESIYQLGRCLIKKERFNDAIEKFNLFMQRAPHSNLNKEAYFLVGECHEKLNDMNKAISIYKELVDMPPFDSVSTRARKKIKALQK